ncbi:MAG TPA: alcohol dehydrogenase catalytic domain-containing protein [Chloroflexota bacterium]|nr:alcohol dehydrogenase catalytic domain-containing protein [Chloroflexota bacterium]
MSPAAGIPSTMKAAVIRAWNEVHVEEVPIPAFGPGEVLIRVKACGICPTDLRIVAGAYAPHWPKELPFIYGHEWVGQVAAVGEGVTNVKVGDRVAGENHIGCRECRMCRQGRYNLCDRAEDGTQVVYGHDAPGAFSEYISRPAMALHPMPDAVSFEDGVIINQGAMVLHGANRAEIGPGDSVAISGPGLCGLLALQIARAKGATSIIMIGRGHRLEVAKELGADHVVDITREDPAKAVQALTGGLGADVGMECSGNPDALEPLTYAVRRGARVAVIGLNGKKQVPIITDRVALDEVDLIGVRGSPGEYPRFISLMAAGMVSARGLVTHTFPLAEINEAMQAFRERRGNAIRVAIQI